MTSPAIKQTEQEPDFYDNQSWMVGEIVLAQQILSRKINELRTQNQAKTAVGQKRAAEEVMRLAEQLHLCAKTVADKSDEYLKVQKP